MKLRAKAAQRRELKRHVYSRRSRKADKDGFPLPVDVVTGERSGA